MTTAYTSLLGLALPVTGELSGTWGDTVNDYITQYLDASVAGTQTISGSQTAVTLSKTTNASLSQAGSGATGSSQYNVINCTGNPASMLTVTVPAASKTYVVVNATSTNQDVKIVGAGPTTGVTLVAGERAIIAWNGSDFIKVATSTADGVTTLSFGTTGLTPSSATSGAVTVAGTLVAANGGTGQSSYTTGDLLYATGSTALSKLGIGTNGQILTSTGTAPQWSTLSGVAVTTFSAGTTGFTPSSATSGAVTLAGTLATTNGGTGLTSFTANGVVYASSSSALTTGSALTFDGTYFTVGASATTGDYKAFIQKSGGELLGLNASSGTLTRIAFGNANASFGSTQIIANAADLAFITNSAEQMRLTSTGLGIGTSSPAYKLDVAGIGRLTTAVNSNATSLILNNSNTAAGGVGVSIDGYSGNASNKLAQIVFGGAGATGGNIDFLTSANGSSYVQQMRLDTSGNLGIGTTSPTQKLTVNGNIETQNAGYVRSVGTGSDTAGVGPNIGVNSSAAIYYIQQLNASNGLDFWYYNAGWNKRLTLDSSGNLGLGVTPSASWDSIFKAIQIGSASYLSIAAQTTATARGSILWNAVGSGDESFVYRNTGDPANRFMVGSGFYAWYTAPSGTAGNAISFTQAMTLDSSGNLGLGVTPSAWSGYGGVIELKGIGFVGSANTNMQLGANFYYNGTNSIYKTTAAASLYQQNAGFHYWYTAGSGTAGNIVTFTQAMTLDASGNFMVGATSSSAIANKNIDVNGTGDSALVLRVGGTTTAYLYSIASQAILGTVGALPITFNPNGTERARITSTGDVGIGTSSPGARLNAVVSYVASTIVPSLKLSTVGGYNTDSGTAIDFGQDQGNYPTWVTGRVASPRTGSNWGGSLTFSTNDDSSATALVERARITSGGYFKASNDGTYASPTGALHELKGNPDDNVLRVQNYQATLTGAIGGVRIIYSAASPNTTSRSFLFCDDSTALRAEIRSNGGIANYQANDVNLSDQRLKTDVQPSGSYLDKICAIPVKTFLYKDQTDTERNLGVMAQDVDAVAPELIDHSGFGEAPEGESPYLAVYQTDLQYALMKCIQELKAQNDDLRARVAQLEAK